MGNHYSCHLPKYELDMPDPDDASGKRWKVQKATMGVTDFVQKRAKDIGRHGYVSASPPVVFAVRRFIFHLIHYYYKNNRANYLAELKLIEGEHGSVACSRRRIERR